MNSVKKSPLSYGVNLGKIIDSRVGNPAIVYVRENEKIDLTALTPKEHELVLDNVDEDLIHQSEKLGIVIRTLLLHKPISKPYHNVRIYESKVLSILDNLPKHKCRWEVPDINTLLKSTMKMWYICREPKEVIGNFFSAFGNKMKTVEDSQYEITYFNDRDSWLYTVYSDKFSRGGI